MQYAEERLEEGPDAGEVRAGHARFFNGIAAGAADGTAYMEETGERITRSLEPRCWKSVGA
jgi:hypothetical protein